MDCSPRVTLTFDNGPTPQVTRQVLDCLAKHRIKTTFFVVGRKVATPEGAPLIQEAYNEGHRIGNHTYSHSTPLGELDAGPALSEINRTEEALSFLPVPVRLFRPYGKGGRLGRHLLHPAVVQKLQQASYTCVLWNYVPGDWRDPDGWMERALAHCLSHPWSLVALHDIASGAMVHLDAFLSRLRSEGAEFAQDYPPECVPIVDGRIVLPLDEYVAQVPLAV